MDQWFDPTARAGHDAVSEAEARHRRHAAAPHRRTTPFRPTRRRTEGESL